VLDSLEYFGPYHGRLFPLQLGGTQKMVYDESDEGPFHMSHTQKE
jgi:hypothetical protein